MATKKKVTKKRTQKRKSDKLNAAVGKRLASLRHESGQTQAALAEDIGIHVFQLSQYEQGRRAPSLPNLLRICNHFEVSSDWLLGLEE